MDKSIDAFRTISEVGEELALPQHVLRFWETRFTQIKPLKRGGGRRYYRPDDVELVRAIKHLLYGEGYTIKGVQRILKEQGVKALVAASRQIEAGGPRPAFAQFEETGVASNGDRPPDGAETAAGEATGPDSGDLPHATVALLRAALAEIDECTRLLALARHA